MKTNIINHEEISTFISTLDVYDSIKVKAYLNQVIKNYIYRQAKVKRTFPEITNFLAPHDEKNFLKKDGPFHKVVLNSELYNKLKNALDYIASLKTESQERILRISVEDAIKHHEDWVRQTNSKTDETEGLTDRVVTYKNGFKLVKLLDKQSFQREGKLMKHCVGAYSTDKNIYSLRDANNYPLVTLEVEGSSVRQLRQASNEAVDKKYYPYVKHFLKVKDLTLSKVVDQNINQVMPKAIQMGMIFMLGAKWKEVIQWLNLNGDSSLELFLSNSTVASVFSLACYVLAIMRGLELVSSLTSAPRESLHAEIEKIEFLESVVEDEPLAENEDRLPDEIL